MSTAPKTLEQLRKDLIEVNLLMKNANADKNRLEEKRRQIIRKLTQKRPQKDTPVKPTTPKTFEQLRKDLLEVNLLMKNANTNADKNRLEEKRRQIIRKLTQKRPQKDTPVKPTKQIALRTW